MKISYLGPKGSFSYEACLMYGKNLTPIECSTITNCIEKLKNDNVDYAIVPIENSIQGGVTEAIDTIISSEKIYIEAELVLAINQNLLAKNNVELNKINKIYSHPQAINQCRNFLSKNNLLNKIEEVNSTSLGAQKVKEENSNNACICNLSCEKEYDLTILKKDIQDCNNNQTRFWVLCKNDNYNSNPRKLAMIFYVTNKPGALYEALQIFNVLKINLTRIESRPAKTSLGDYLFLIEADINENVDTSLKLLADNKINFRVLGKY